MSPRPGPAPQHLTEPRVQASQTAPSSALRGFGSPYLRGRVWWIRYHHRGQEVRESSRSERRLDAERLLKNRLAQLGRGKFIGPREERVVMNDLFDTLVRD